MAKRVKVELNHSAIQAFLQSDEVMMVCEEKATAALSSLGSGYEISPYVGKGRVNVSVSARTVGALHDAYENNSIMKALLGGGE